MAKRILQGPAPTKMIDKSRQPANKSATSLVPQRGGK